MHKETKGKAVLDPQEDGPAQEADKEMTLAVASQAEPSAEGAGEDIMGYYFGESPIKNSEKILEVQDPLVEINLGSAEKKRPMFISSRLSTEQKKSLPACSEATKTTLLGSMRRCWD